jgi:steroid delta-isomerase-like uncharacterized protein
MCAHYVLSIRDSMRKMIGRELVLRYYTELWNRWDLGAAQEILSLDFRFRGSLGQVTRGVGPFLEYVGTVRRAFPDFFNAVEDVIERPGKVVARLTYTGTHRGLLFGIPPTQKSISYAGVAIFRTGRGRLTEGWVVADRLMLLEQLLGPTFWHKAAASLPAREPLEVPGAATPGAEPLEVRAASESDLEWCAGLMVRSEPWITLKRSRDEAHRILTAPSKECYLACRAEARVGFVLLDMGGGLPGYIQSVCVVPELRQRGLGTRLIRFAEERILRDAHNVFMCVSSFNGAAQRLYERLGYERVGDLRNYMIRGASEILLRKTSGPLKDPSGEPASRK